MSDPSRALMNGFMYATLGGLVGYLFYQIVNIKHKPISSIDYGRRCFAVTIGIVSFAILPEFFRLLDVDSLLKWSINVVSWGLLAYGAGWSYGRFFRKNKAQSESKKSSTKNIITSTSKQGKVTQMNSYEFSNGEEDLYEIISQELETGNINKALWTKLYSEHNGDDIKIRASYIKNRYEFLSSKMDEYAQKMNGNEDKIRTVEIGLNIHQGKENKSSKNNVSSVIKLQYLYTILLFVVIVIVIYFSNLYNNKTKESQLATEERRSTASGETTPSDYEGDYYKTEKAALQGDAKAQFSLGVMYYKGEGVAKDYEKAFHWVEKSAQNGNLIAQYNLGNLYFNGDGVSIDLEKSVYWYEKAALKDYVPAQYKLGHIYHYADSVPQDHKKAFYWLEKAALKDNVSAQRELGMMYSFVNKDDQKAAYWYEKAALKDDLWTQRVLAKMYYDGKGVSQDYHKALYWFEKAALKDDGSSQFWLGKMYYDGTGVLQDYQKSLYWHEISGHHGNVLSAGVLGELYELGKGTEKNIEKAYIWYSIAIKYGDTAYIKDRDRLEKKLSNNSLEKVRDEINSICESINTKRNK